MSPLEIRTSSEAEKTVRGVCQDMARRLVSHPQGTCPVDVTRGLIALVPHANMRQVRSLPHRLGADRIAARQRVGRNGNRSRPCANRGTR